MITKLHDLTSWVGKHTHTETEVKLAGILLDNEEAFLVKGHAFVFTRAQFNYELNGIISADLEMRPATDGDVKRTLRLISIREVDRAAEEAFSRGDLC